MTVLNDHMIINLFQLQRLKFVLITVQGSSDEAHQKKVQIFNQPIASGEIAAREEKLKFRGLKLGKSKKQNVPIF